MTRRSQPVDHSDLFQHVIASGDGAPSIHDKLTMVQLARAGSADAGLHVDRFFIENLVGMHDALVETKNTHDKLSDMIDKLTGTPWHPARFVASVPTPMGTRALVLYGHSFEVVDFHDAIDPSSLDKGDTVYLSREHNLVMAKADEGFPACGETAQFERVTEDGRVVLRHRDEELIVERGARLDAGRLEPGQQIRWDRAAMLALEVIAGSAGERYILSKIADVRLSEVGGQEAALRAVLNALTARLTDPKIAAEYGVSGKRAILLAGPPGSGKTLIARACAAEIQRITGKTCRFAVVKPGEWLSPWVGETEENIRKCFKALAEAAGDALVVVFIDEIEAIGRIRGRSSAHHEDRFLTTLLAEIDGFADRGEIAVIAATNRKDLLDPALVDRICDVDITVRRPDRRGAREIFAIHLGESLLYYANGVPAEETREQMIDRGVARLYGSGADNEICTVHFRDSTRRTINAHELVSGRMIEQICKGACSHAFERHVRGDGAGLRSADIEYAVDASIERLRTTLTAHNARAYLDDLPQDIDIVRVEPVVPQVKSSYRYLRV